MIKLILKLEDNMLYFTYAFGNNNVISREKASVNDTDELLEILKENKNTIKNIHYFGDGNVEFYINLYNNLCKVTILDISKFKKYEGFKFLFDFLKSKNYKLVKKRMFDSFVAVGLTFATLIPIVKTASKSKQTSGGIIEESSMITYVDDATFYNNMLSTSEKITTTVPNPVTTTNLDPTTESTALNVHNNEDEMLKKYKSNAALGFVVTTNNKTYNLSDSDKNLLSAIVSAESDKTLDDALAVITTILNRCESPEWINHGSDPVSQATAYNQFVVYQHGDYKDYLGNTPESVKIAVNDALENGIRNHNYLSFRSNEKIRYSDNQITSRGNRYK